MLRGLEEEDPAQKDEGIVATRLRPGTTGKEEIDGCLCHERTVVMKLIHVPTGAAYGVKLITCTKTIIEIVNLLALIETALK